MYQCALWEAGWDVGVFTYVNAWRRSDGDTEKRCYWVAECMCGFSSDSWHEYAIILHKTQRETNRHNSLENPFIPLPNSINTQGTNSTWFTAWCNDTKSENDWLLFSTCLLLYHTCVRAHTHAILCLSLPPSWNACAMMLSAKLWLLITRQIDFINHPGNRSSVMSSGSAISQKSSMKNSAQQAFYQAIYLIYRPASCQKQLPNNRLIKHEIYWATAA